MITRREIADPLVEIREILETYRTCGITLQNWDQILASAAERLQSAAVVASEPDIATQLPRHVQFLIVHGLDPDDPTFVAAADLTSELLSSIRIPGIPTPDDENRHFDQQSTGAES